MNPQFDQSPGLPLPQPPTNGGLPMQYAPPIVQTAPPQGAYSPQAMSGVQQPQPMPVGPSASGQQSMPPTPAPSAATVPSGDDDAVVDEEWVNKAREVVARYRSDPFAQSRELSRVKAQYLKARYNKDIKVSEDK